MNALIIRALITAVLLAGSAIAQSAPLPASYSAPVRLMLTGQQQTSLDQAIAQVRRQTGGRILSANTVNQGGRKTHRIKVLMPNGVVRVVNVNAGNRR